MNIDYSYKYQFESTVSSSADGGNLALATSEIKQVYPYFFEGRLLQPRAAALMLFTLARYVSTRFFIPPNMLKKLVAERDPVITSGSGMLRFEGFTACCSAYARVDVEPDGYVGKTLNNGTTNVDFNSQFRSALAGIRDGERMSMSVGSDEIKMKHGFGEYVERKVKLPVRWIKGFVEVQSYQSQMEHRLTVGKAEAIKFIRSISASTPGQVISYVVPSGRGIRLSQTDQSGIKVGGINRLAMLKDLAPLADELRIYCHPSGDSSEWQLKCGPLVFSLTLTAEPSRGFSGEGQALSDLITAEEERLSMVRSALKWQSMLDIQRLSDSCQMDSDSIRSALGVLGSRGIVGYDLARNAYFHREMPFDLELVDSIHPRLKAARKLVQNNGVKILVSQADSFESEVAGTGANHTVKGNGDVVTCTCPWYSKYQGNRGPCKHVLATRMTLEPEDSDEQD